MVDSDRYLLICQRYIEMNPVRAGIVSAPADFQWSSHRYYAFGNNNPLLTPHPVVQGLAMGQVQRREAYKALFSQALQPELIDLIRTTANQGWALGSERFLQHVEGTLGRSVRPPKRGRPRKVVAGKNPGEMLI
ncbi:MAG: transposase [Betaproteobacteria bacterium]|nr:transposase [Betaproteobacteria bacterium]